MGGEVKAKDFWLKEITKHTSLAGNVLTLQVKASNRIDLNALQIRFRDDCCTLIGAKQIKAEAEYNFFHGYCCVKAIIDGDVLRWQTKVIDTRTPRELSTGDYKNDRKFMCFVVTDMARRFEDITGIQTYALYKSNKQPRQHHNNVFEDDDY